jgi:C-terminal processing protease CtpA/Prc
VPSFGIYSRDGKWIIEGYGVDPDIEVVDDPAAMRRFAAMGVDFITSNRPDLLREAVEGTAGR